MLYFLTAFAVAFGYLYYRKKSKKLSTTSEVNNLEGIPNRLESAIEESTLDILNCDIYMHYSQYGLTEKRGDPEWENQEFHFWLAREKFERKSLPKQFQSFDQRIFFISSDRNDISIVKREVPPEFGMEGGATKYTFVRGKGMLKIRQLARDGVIRYLRPERLDLSNLNILQDKDNYFFLLNHCDLRFIENRFYLDGESLSISEAFKNGYLMIVTSAIYEPKFGESA
ncbi:hypothetical protein [Vibrio genomosp. F10]|uniref:hypothetical protein n=1 Tax=Vibrio genomosp. F10 TaxID=723171 RepID=UPI0002F05D5B|nr:hypothetical protein [Vibrio genomosp. F10]OEF13415.1 hypothetical protein A1QK_21630 [Vibrio genomosp. F10 str. 9ZD137]